MQKDKDWQREMTTIFEKSFLLKMIFSIEFSLGSVIFDDFRSNLRWQLKCAVYYKVKMKW